MKNVVIYHRADFDGIFCREIAKHYFGDKAEYIGWDYGDAKLEFPNDAFVHVLDLSPECFETSTIISENLVWIDHHKSAIEKYPPSWPGYRIDGVAACRLAWQWFFGDRSADKSDYEMRQVEEPWAVRLAGEYDIWDKRDPDADTYQFGLRSRTLTDGDWNILLNLESDTLTRPLLRDGALIQNYQREKDAGICNACAFTVEFEGVKFLALNTAGRGSMQFASKDVPETGHDALLKFSWTGAHWDVSLYHAKHRKDLDLSLIAGKYGGGGHRGACGFRTNKLPFLS